MYGFRNIFAFIEQNDAYDCSKEGNKMTTQDHLSNIESTYWVSENDIGSIPIILHKQESLPDIYSTKNFFIVIDMGRILIQLDDQEDRIYSPGNIIDVPSRTKIKIKNLSDKTAILVIKLKHKKAIINGYARSRQGKTWRSE